MAEKNGVVTRRMTNNWGAGMLTDRVPICPLRLDFLKTKGAKPFWKTSMVEISHSWMRSTPFLGLPVVQVGLSFLSCSEESESSSSLSIPVSSPRGPMFGCKGILQKNGLEVHWVVIVRIEVAVDSTRGEPVKVGRRWWSLDADQRGAQGRRKRLGAGGSE